MKRPLKTKPVIFVSHSGSERFLEALRRYCGHLEVVVSDWTDGSGESLAAKVKADMRRSDIVVAVLSKRAGTSAWVQQEIGLAVGLSKPIVPISATRQPALPGLLDGLEWTPLAPNRLEETALRVATRVAEVLSRDLVRSFCTFGDYCKWWETIPEADYTNDLCLWAAPHDLWSWFAEHRGQRAIRYRTLVRGSLPFDLETVAIHFGGTEFVTGVQELSALNEIHVFGNLTVETFYTPEFIDSVGRELSKNPSRLQLHQWFASHASTPTVIEVRLSMDPDKAASNRQRLESLFSKYKYDQR